MNVERINEIINAKIVFLLGMYVLSVRIFENKRLSKCAFLYTSTSVNFLLFISLIFPLYEITLLVSSLRIL